MQPTIGSSGTSRIAVADDAETLAPSPPLTSQVLASSTASMPVSGSALILRAQLRTDRHQRPYVALTLRFADAAVIEARWWQFPHTPDRCPHEGTVYSFTGWAEAYNGIRQLHVTSAEPIPHVDLSPFVPSVQRSLADLLAEYEARVTHLDESLAALVRLVISGETLERFRTWPAAQYKHGAVRHGLLAHSLCVAALAESFATVYSCAALPHDRALVTAAALLHDVGKTQTLPSIAGSALPTVASYLDHVTLGALMVRSAADHIDAPIAPERLEALLHIILAHHGRTDWGAPIEPQTVEAWLVHVPDYTESRLWRFTDDAPSTATPSLADQP